MPEPQRSFLPQPRLQPDPGETAPGTAADTYPLRASDAERRRTLEHLDAGLATGMLDLDEFARRSHDCYLATDRHELHLLVRDLPVPDGAIGAEATSATVRATLGSIRRLGHWECPGQLDFVLRYSNALVDFGLARFERAETRLRFDMTGSRVRLIVPRGSTVVTDDLEVVASRAVNNVGRGRGAGRVFVISGRIAGTTLSIRHRPLL